MEETTRKKPRATPRSQLETLANRISKDLAAVQSLFETPGASKISAAARAGVFMHLERNLAKVKMNSEASHEKAVMTSGTFSLDDAEALAAAGPSFGPAAGTQTFNQLHTAPRPPGYVPVESRNPALVYDEVTGKPIGRRSGGVPKPAGGGLVPDREAGFLDANTDPHLEN